ncbi:unnamed protein product [Linum trigynum]|uniref:Uncharacterized protein n=1 Tax=Linum trigynum TaxID=586398 RepID=A0AAV2EHM6_9ROSI
MILIEAVTVEAIVVVMVEIASSAGNLDILLENVQVVKEQEEAVGMVIEMMIQIEAVTVDAIAVQTMKVEAGVVVMVETASSVGNLDILLENVQVVKEQEEATGMVIEMRGMEVEVAEMGAAMVLIGMETVMEAVVAEMVVAVVVKGVIDTVATVLDHMIDKITSSSDERLEGAALAVCIAVDLVAADVRTSLLAFFVDQPCRSVSSSAKLARMCSTLCSPNGAL